ncbi:MAG: succinylglutamate desuccinylase/aspartoacylase family protein [Chitinophagales bacterium]
MYPKRKVMHIYGQEILPGEQKQINLEIAKLPSRTPISIPVFVNRSTEPGPSLLIMAGMHGDEINGVEIVRRIMKQNLHIPERGSIICIPILNVYGFISQARELPDGKDMNRSFPGSEKGSLASRVAYIMMHEIIPNIDLGIDFHTGGGIKTNFPQVRCKLEDEQNKELAKAFNAPFTLNSPFRAASLRSSAAKKGISILVYEGGESLRLDSFAIEQGIKGYQKVLCHLKMGNVHMNPDDKNIVLMNSSWIRARGSGIFQSNVKTGDYVSKGQFLGRICSPYTEFEIKVKSSKTGHVIALNHQAVVNQGDALMHIGFEE